MRFRTYMIQPAEFQRNQTVGQIAGASDRKLLLMFQEEPSKKQWQRRSNSIKDLTEDVDGHFA